MADRPALTMPTPAELSAYRQQQNTATGTYNGFKVGPDGNYVWQGPVTMDPRLQQRIDYAKDFYDPKTGKYLGDPSKMPLAAKLILGGTLGVAGGMALAPLLAGGGAAATPSVGAVGTGVPSAALGTPTALGYGAGTAAGIGGATTAGAGTVAGTTGAGGTTAGVGGTAAGTSLTDRILKGLTSKEGLSAIGQALTGASQGRAAGRAAEANYLLSRDALSSRNNQVQQDAIISAILADLQQRQFAANEYQRQTGNAIQGGLLQGVQDAEITGLPPGVTMGQVSGGLRPSAITNKNEIGRILQEQAMQDMLNPVQASPINYGAPTGQTPSGRLPQISVLDQPTLSTPSQPGGFDTFLNIAGPVAAGAGTFLGGTEAQTGTPSSTPSGTGTNAPSSTTAQMTQNLRDVLVQAPTSGSLIAENLAQGTANTTLGQRRSIYDQPYYR